MLINGEHFRTIWPDPDDDSIVWVIDQRFLPHEVKKYKITSTKDACYAISEMVVRGAPLIGGATAYGFYFALKESGLSENPDQYLSESIDQLIATRPTAVNLIWAVEQQKQAISGIHSFEDKVAASLREAAKICDDDVDTCYNIGKYGKKIIREIFEKKQDTVNILTHCNAGWLACIDWGTATSSIYQSFDDGIPVHVWVDETRPRNQGASLTAFELGQHNIPHTVIADNAAGHLMQTNQVDMVITGTDRTTLDGDVINKIGTYTKALAAYDNDIPFYVALPSSSIDWKNRAADIEIEERNPDEVRYVKGLNNGSIISVLITPENSNAKNYGFDITPSRLVKGLITERGVASPSQEGISSLFPEKADQK